jgi:hypothetical protein
MGDELRWLADENFNNEILRALLRRKPDIALLRVQDCGLSGASDPELLEWAAIESRLILTHDESTFTVHARARIASGRRMAGLFLVSARGPISAAIDDILLITECSEAGEWEGQVRYLPLR